MIIETIVLENFGLYKGRQEIQLAPLTPEQPIILFGGLNGSGKTTFLDGLQLALFGKLARCSNRGDLPYQQFLLNSIHRGVDPTVGAVVQIDFRHQAEGEDTLYRVRRAWSVKGDSLTEDVEVFKNSIKDAVLSKIWEDSVGSFVPPAILDLFFFDGEKIAKITDGRQTAKFLKSAVYSLLGLDIVERLQNHMTALEKRKRTEKPNTEAQAKFIQIETELNQLYERRNNLKEESEKLKTELELFERKHREIEEEYWIKGGSHYEHRQEYLSQKENVERLLKGEIQSSVGLAAGPLPLILVGDLLEDVLKQAAKEAEADIETAFAEQLDSRDQSLLLFMKEQNANHGLAHKLEHFLAEDRLRRLERANETERYLCLPKSELEQLGHLTKGALSAEQSKAGTNVARLTELERERDELVALLARIPHEDDFKEVADRKLKSERDLLKLRVQLESKLEELERNNQFIKMKKTQLANWFETKTDEAYQENEVKRFSYRSSKAINLIERFQKRLAEQHIQQLEQLIFKSFCRLIRKEHLITDLSIDPDNWDLILRTRDGAVLPKNRLSAGELQLLAVAVLWGLAQASGRPLPCVIDTPLGRLDSTHRELLLKRYYPYASHQVILLSTDKEVDASYLEMIRSYVGRSYHLVFDETTCSTSVQPGYFREEAPRAH